MKITFLCGSLESGKDGVGDYTRRLSGELIRQGHEVSIIALNDRFLKSAFIKEHQYADGTRVCVLRLSSNIKWKERMAHARRWIDEQNPEWLSLQYVCFGFQKKGLPFGLAGRLKRLGVGRKWHIMFHELWVGMALEDSIKLKLWGYFQHNLVKRLLNILRPVVIHTQTRLYQIMIRKLGFLVNYLPLFSNFPIKEILKREIKISTKTITLILFGVIHKDCPINTLAEEVFKYSYELNKKIHLILIGRNGTEQQKWVDVWRKVGLTVDILGEQSPESVSSHLIEADAGISTTAYAVIEKSGSAAALHAHGLPILCVSRKWTPIAIKNFDQIQGIFNYSPGNFKDFLFWKERGNIVSLGSVAESLIKTLNTKEKGTYY